MYYCIKLKAKRCGMKKVQIGARVNVEDAEFINLLEINGATTPSDKLRAIIEEARLRREYLGDFSGSYRMVQEQVAPIMERLKKAEFEMETQSLQLTRILEWLPEFYAYTLSSLPLEIDSERDLVDYEKGVIDKVTRLFESLLHLELSSQKSSYSNEFMEKHMSHLADLIKIVMTTANKQEGGK
jgi:hypothetical protein